MEAQQVQELVAMPEAEVDRRLSELGIDIEGQKSELLERLTAMPKTPSADGKGKRKAGILDGSVNENQLRTSWPLLLAYRL